MYVVRKLRPTESLARATSKDLFSADNSNLRPTVDIRNAGDICDSVNIDSFAVNNHDICKPVCKVSTNNMDKECVVTEI